MNFDKKQLRNTLLLLLGALIWGTAFVAQSVGSGYVGPYTFLAARSWLACAFLIVLVLLRRGKAAKRIPVFRSGSTAGCCCGAVRSAALRCLRLRRHSRSALAPPARPRRAF